MLQFKRLNKKLLLEYANSQHFGKGTDIPISFHRAISQSLNPRLNSTDILLILAIGEGRLVGYTGILPDKLFDKTGKSNRFGWLSCLWVSPTARNKGIGKGLIEEAVKAWDGRILSSDYAPETKGLYDASGAFLTTPFELEGLRLYIKSDLQNILPPKHQRWVKLKPALKAIDFLANMIADLRIPFISNAISELNVEFVDGIDDEATAFIAKHNQSELFRRSERELNWILSNPWVISSPKKDAINAKYFFSSTAKVFEYHVVKLSDSKKVLKSVLILSRREGTLKIPYFFYDGDLDDVLKLIKHVLLKWKIRTLTIFHKGLKDHVLKSRTPALFKKKVHRRYMIGGKLESEFNVDYNIQDGDGDSCFT